MTRIPKIHLYSRPSSQGAGFDGVGTIASDVTTQRANQPLPLCQRKNSSPSRTPPAVFAPLPHSALSLQISQLNSCPALNAPTHADRVRLPERIGRSLIRCVLCSRAFGFVRRIALFVHRYFFRQFLGKIDSYDIGETQKVDKNIRKF